MENEQLFTLLLGAAGALCAIFLKEAFQLAMQRRTIAWQLFGYLNAFKSQFVEVPGIVQAWAKIREQEMDLTAAYQQGAEAFRAQQDRHIAYRTEFRDRIQRLLLEALAEPGGLGPAFEGGVIAIQRQQLAISRQMMIDSKSFISDRDAAVLGPQAVIHATNFRMSWLAMLSAFDTLMAVQEEQGIHNPQQASPFVKVLVRNGEVLMVSHIHLERVADDLTSKHLPSLVIGTWR